MHDGFQGWGLDVSQVDCRVEDFIHLPHHCPAKTTKREGSCNKHVLGPTHTHATEETASHDAGAHAHARMQAQVHALSIPTMHANFASHMNFVLTR